MAMKKCGYQQCLLSLKDSGNYKKIDDPHQLELFQ